MLLLINYRNLCLGDHGVKPGKSHLEVSPLSQRNHFQQMVKNAQKRLVFKEMKEPPQLSHDWTIKN